MPPTSAMCSKRWTRFRSIIPKQSLHIVPAFASYGSRLPQVQGQPESQLKWFAG